MNIYETVEGIAESRMSQTAMILWGSEGETRRYTYKEMIEGVAVFSETLASLGLKKGFRVAIIAESCPEWSLAYLAVLKTGGTPALIDSSLAPLDLVDLLSQSDPACVYASDATVAKLGSCATLPVLDIHDYGRPFAEFSGRKCPATQEDCDERVASIIFSSGTTRRASGVMHGHEAIMGSAIMCCDNNGVGADDRFFGVLPCSHIYGLYVQVIAPLILGGSVCFIEKLDAACLVAALQGYKPTVFPAVPKVFELLKTNVLKVINGNPKTEKLYKIFFPICFWLRKHFGIKLGLVIFKSVNEGFGGHLRVIASAGAPTDKETSEFFYGIGLNLLITYGATETSIPVIGNYGGQVTTETCGKPYPGIEIKYSPEGEVLVKSPFLMLGYFRDEETTLASYDEGGWFKTGDQAYLDQEQNVHFYGRLKDNIVLSTGKKVAPDDIETAYAGIHGVRDFAICGIPVSEGGYDRTYAFVVTADDATQDTVRDAFLERSRDLEQNMKLHGIHFVNEIPKTTLQKPKRFLLRQAYQAEAAECETAPENVVAAKDLQGFLTATVARLAGVGAAEVSGSTRIFEDLAIDSLGAIELILEVEAFMDREFDEIPDSSITFDELIKAISDTKEAANNTAAQASRFSIQKKKPRDYGLFNMCRRFMALFYNINIKNDNLLPKDSGYIICSNHVSNFDYLFLTAKFKKEQFMTFCCMAKQELQKKTPFSALLARVAGMIPVDREGNATISMKTAKEKLMENWGMLIHPEGTRTRTGEMADFKHGAALLALESGVPIVPAYIKGGYEVFPAGRALPKLFNWKAGKKFNIEVIYGDPILPENETVDTLMQRLNAAVQQIAGGDAKTAGGE